MSEKKPYYITTAIAYASRKPHIGNTYEVILTDAIARFKRLQGYDVYFCTGTDEHGQKIENYAKADGITPKQYVDKVAGEIKNIWDLVGASYDKFIRTTDDYHTAAVQNIFKKLYDQGDIYKGEYEDWYCVPCESFYTDTQLVDGKCPDCGCEVKKIKEETYYFKMSNYSERLIKYIEENPDFITPEPRKKEMINNFLKPGLQDLCVSRTSFKWGVPVPFDEKHVIYVWIDALANYITALGYDVGKGSELFDKYWPADVHIIGKDILRFHTIYWPIILMALGLPLPKMVFGHPWLNSGTDKMSKSKGNVIYADDLVRHFGVDAVRHYVLSEIPYAADGCITYENIIDRYNSDLANNLGNLVSRTIAMTKKYFNGKITNPAVCEAPDDDLRNTVAASVEAYMKQMESFHLADASDTVFNMLRRANKYIDETTPWTLAKDESRSDRLATVLYNLLETVRIGAVLLTPLMPTTAETIFGLLNTEKRGFDSLSFGALETGNCVNDASPLFNRIDAEKMIAELLEEAPAKAPAKPEGVAQIGIDDFMKTELRTALVVSCEKVEKSDKLLKLELDLGYEKRQVVSGIAKSYAPEDLIGKKLIVVANLAPAKLRGVESNGMILASGEDKVRVVFLDGDTPLGERVR